MRPRNRDRGIALLLALLVLIILVLLVGQMAVSSLQDRTVAENHLGDLQNTLSARSGYYTALLYLEADLEREASVDHLRERWSQPLQAQLGTGSAEVTIRDSERFVNLSRLTDAEGKANEPMQERLSRLMRILDHPEEAAERIIDYVDVDTRGNFETGARNAPLMNLDELLRIEGLEPEVLYGVTEPGREKKGVLEFLTIWPKARPGESSSSADAVNVNTAPVEVLQSLSEEMTPEAAEAIVSHRNRSETSGKPQPISDVQQIMSLNGMDGPIFASIADQLVVKSETFEIEVLNRAGRVEKRWLYVVHRSAEEEQNVVITLLTSRRVSDFLEVRLPEEGLRP